MKDGIIWLGHAGIRLSGSRTVVIDPYRLNAGRPADIVCITHPHYDHFSPEDLERVRGPETVVVTVADVAEKLSGRVDTIAPGRSLTVDGVRIEAVLAYNLDKPFHPKANGWVGFVVELDGRRIYHAGDTDFVAEMRSVRADVAVLPVGGTYTMDTAGALAAAAAIRPGLVVPIHWGAIVGDRSDAEAFRDGWDGATAILDPEG